MDRSSTQHGPAKDDQLVRQSEGMVRGGGTAHAEEWTEPGPTDQLRDRAAGKEPDYRRPAAPPGMSPPDVAVRSNVAGRLGSAEFPATRESLLPSDCRRASIKSSER